MNFQQGGNPFKKLNIGKEAQWRDFLQEFVPAEKLELILKYAVIDSNIRRGKDKNLTLSAIRALSKIDKNFDKIVLIDNLNFFNKGKIVNIESHQTLYNISHENIRELKFSYNIDVEAVIESSICDNVIHPFCEDNIETIYIYQLYCAKIEKINNNISANEIKILSRYNIIKKEKDNIKDEGLKHLIKQGL